MPKLTEILKQPEGRRLEFKAKLPNGKMFSDMDSGQSDIRNKTLAPVFTRLGIIEQWGNGLKLIKEELQTYPEIELSWKEPGIAFRVTFINKNYQQQQELQHELQHELQYELQHELQQELEQELQQESLYGKVLRLVQKQTSSTQELSTALGQKSISGQLYTTVNKLKEDGLIEWTVPDKPKSSKQQYKTTPKGNLFVKLLESEK